MKTGLVYCVVVTYNGMQWIEKCLNSLIASSYKSYIIVIDNGSKDLTASFIKTNYPDIHLIETGKNLGFGQANNIGLNKTMENNADHVFLLNQDAWVEQDTIANLVKAQNENPEYGILSPLHLKVSGNDFDEYFHNYFTRSDVKEMNVSVLLKKNNLPLIINTSFVNAAAWLIGSDCIKSTGGFDPIFFHYGEDDNYAHRVLFKGFKIGILINSKMYHDREISDSKYITDVHVRLKKDWIIFLAQACNVQEPNYVGLVIKRFSRYFFLTIVNLITFNKEKVFYNFSMAKKISLSFLKIRKSRAFGIKGSSPYLNITAGHKV